MVCAKERRLDLPGFGSGVVFGVSTSTSTNRELDTIALELTTEGNRLQWGGLSVQEVDLFERQTLGLEQDMSGDHRDERKYD